LDIKQLIVYSKYYPHLFQMNLKYPTFTTTGNTSDHKPHKAMPKEKEMMM